MRNASSIEVERSSTSSRRSFRIMMTVSQTSRSASAPAWACGGDACPRTGRGMVTMPTVGAPTSRASWATTGAAPEPVPPPSPAVTKTMSEPRSTCLI